MKVEVSEEGTVFCDGLTCSKWIESETTCENCPIDKIFFAVMKYHEEQGKQIINHLMSGKYEN